MSVLRYTVTLLFIAISCYAHAGHLIGGEISYTQIGDNTYVIELRMYRDCYAVNAVQRFDQFVNLSVYDGGGSNNLLRVINIERSADSTRLPLSVNFPCLPNPPDLCILEMVYRDTLEIFVPANGVYLVNQRCCRSPNSINIVNPADFGSTYSTFIPGSNLLNNEYNTSPKFNSVPPIALCLGIATDLDYSATDADGDSLYYEFCDPYHGGGPTAQNGMPAPDTPSAPPFTTIYWENSYSTSYQLPSSPAFTIDHATGIITGRPNALGLYVLGVCVSEYRDGEKISENKRDFAITVTTCDIEALAVIDSAIDECIGREIQFYNLSTLGESFKWDFGDLSTNTDNSKDQNPIYNYPDTGTYTIRLIAIGETGCRDTTYFEYEVLPKIIPDFELPSSGCFNEHSIDLIPAGFSKSTTTSYWTIDEQIVDPLPELDEIIDYSFTEAGEHSVTLVYEDFGCVKDSSKTILLHPNPTISIIEDDVTDCPPLNAMFTSEAENALLPSYRWFIDDSLASIADILNVDMSTVGTYDISIELITDSVCIDTVLAEYPKHLTILEPPLAAQRFDRLQSDMYEPVFRVFDEKERAIRHTFYLDWEQLTKADSHQYILPDTGNYLISQVAFHQNGCTDTAEQIIRVVPEYLVFTPNSFTPNADGFNDIWYPKVFVWKSFELSIFDRWGHQIFNSQEPTTGWNGRKNNAGTDCPMGSYYYLMYITDPELREWQYTGQIVLYR